MARKVEALVARVDRTTRAVEGVSRSLRDALWQMENDAEHAETEHAIAEDEAAENAATERAITAAGGNLGRAAASLGIHRGTLYARIAKAGLQLEVGGSRGTSPAIPNPAHLSIWVAQSLADRVKAEARQKGVTISDYVRKALEASLGKVACNPGATP